MFLIAHSLSHVQKIRAFIFKMAIFTIFLAYHAKLKGTINITAFCSLLTSPADGKEFIVQVISKVPEKGETGLFPMYMRDQRTTRNGLWLSGKDALVLLNLEYSLRSSSRTP